ncbi:hypothetical protein [Mycobacterium sp. ACS4331]|uniref:hypothetical protein n=1 Tax=Mycobacterium sp. ACS4331 TaxID=1834121 RepID=UPI000801D461|nr:hypothetical protein [Mycobacterium sp. ACS4331]OBF25385.1 hypothetical protein A5727_04425 [Mycobacterium sp. ACS4331]
MSTDSSVEYVAPPEIRRGDVIEDPVGHRWVTVNGIQLSSDSASGAFSFYGTGPDDRVTFNGTESVKRQK